VYENKISKPVSAKICGELQKTPLCVFAFDGENIYTSNASSESISFIKNEGLGKDTIKPLSECKNSLFSISVFGDVKEITDFLKTVPSVDFIPDQYQITAKGVSKGGTMLRLAKLIDVPKKNIIAVGDGENDIDMIINAAVGIAVGGACKNLKDAADIVTDDIENGGILKAFKSLGLI
jgi:hydroxymethylpyrimidine pyrophosphatase-like HAD family hydrolase